MKIVATEYEAAVHSGDRKGEAVENVSDAGEGHTFSREKATELGCMDLTVDIDCFVPAWGLERNMPFAPNALLLVFPDQRVHKVVEHT